MDQDQAGPEGAVGRYVEAVAAAHAERAQKLGLINAQYAAELAGLMPGTRGEDGALVTPQTLYGHYLASRSYAEQACTEAVGQARAAFHRSLGDGAAVPPLPAGAIPPEPQMFPEPQAPAAAAPYRAPLPPAPVAAGPKRAVKAQPKPLWWLVGLFVAAVIGVAAYGSSASKSSADSSSSSSSSGSDYSSTVDVLYEVVGTAAGTDVTLESATGTVQQQNLKVPVTNKRDHTPGMVYFVPRGHYVYLSAQNTGDYGSITCRITVHGTVVSTNTSTGAYAIATCSGTAY